MVSLRKKGFQSNINKKGYSGILIGPDTKSRLKYFYLNTDKQEQIQIKKEKIQEVPFIKTNEKVIAENSNKVDIIKENKDTIIILDLKQKIEQTNSKIELQAKQLQEKEYEITQLENWIKEIENNETKSNLLISDLIFPLFFQGTSIKHSRYDLTTEASAEVGDIILNFENSLLAFFIASFDIPEFSILFCRTSNSSPSSPISPSSF